MLSAIMSLEVVKCTGKYRPINSPLVLDWSTKLSFEVKKKTDNQIVNIIDTITLQKLAQLQYLLIYPELESSTMAIRAYNCWVFSTHAQSQRRTESSSLGWRVSTRAKKLTDSSSRLISSFRWPTTFSRTKRQRQSLVLYPSRTIIFWAMSGGRSGSSSTQRISLAITSITTSFGTR